MIAFLLTLALAQEPPEDPAVEESPPEESVSEAVEPPAAEPEAVEEPVAPVIEVGTVQFFAVKDPVVPALDFDACAVTPSAPRTARTGMEDGQVRLQLTFKKGRISLVTVTETSPSLDWVTPCLKRELAAVEWEIKKGRAEVPVTVTMETGQ